MTGLIERVLAAKHAAEAEFSAHISLGNAPSEAQTAAILIAQVQAIISGDDDPETEPEPTAEKTDGAA